MKTWAYLERVTSADQNAFLQSQVVAQFTSAAQRDSQWPTPPIGAVCYVQGAGLETYNGTAWVPLGTPRGIIASGASGSPAVGAVMPLATVIGGAAGWLAANTITIPVGAGGLYQISLQIGYLSAAILNGAELRDSSNAPLGMALNMISTAPSQTVYQQGSWLRQCADSQTFRVVWTANAPTSASVVRLSLLRIGDSLATA
jgi:hypothetical protein